MVKGSSYNEDTTDNIVVRYNTDGSLDNTFGNNGKLIVESGGAIAIQSDGKFLIIGSLIVRYNADGTLDNTFSGDGKQTPDFRINTSAIQNDGKITVAGEGRIARYNTDGSLDKTFKADLPVREIVSVAIQNDGKILVGELQLVAMNIIPMRILL